MLAALFNDPFFLCALFAGILASIAGGIIGSFVVIRRITFIAGSISHCVLGGIGCALWLKHTYQISWLLPLHGALISALIAAWLLGWIHLRFREREDALTAAIWSTGMAIGVTFLSLTPNTQGDFLHLLFGNILWTSVSDLWLLGILDLLLVLITAWYYHRFVAICFDETQSLLRGIPVQRIYLTLLGLIALSIVALMHVIGSLLVIALLTLPTMICCLLTRRFFGVLLSSIFVSMVINMIGLFSAYQLDLPPGPCICLFAALSYFLTLCYRRKLSPMS